MPQRGRPTVLVVEDDPDLADLYAEWLQDSYAVRTANSGAEALTKVDGTIDVVLLDRRLPDLSGAAVLETIRHDSMNCRVAIVTAVEPAFDVIEMGFDDYLVKSVTKTELVETVDRLVALNAYHDVVQEYCSLARKIGVLEANLSDAELESSEEFLRLAARFDRVKAKARHHLNVLARAGIPESEFARLTDHTIDRSLPADG